MSCEQCIKDTQFDKRLNCPLSQNLSKHITRTEGAMQIDLVPELTPSGDDQNIVRTTDEFSTNLSAYLAQTRMLEQLL